MSTTQNAGIKMLRERLAYLEGDGVGAIKDHRENAERVRESLERARATVRDAEQEATDLRTLLETLEPASSEREGQR